MVLTDFFLMLPEGNGRNLSNIWMENAKWLQFDFVLWIMNVEVVSSVSKKVWLSSWIYWFILIDSWLLMTWLSAKWMMTFLCFVLSPLLLSKCATLNVIYLDLHFGENKWTQNHESTAWIIPWNICPGYLHIYTVIHFWHFPMSFKDNIIKDYWDIFQQWRLHRLCSHFSWWDHSVLSLNSDAHCNPPWWNVMFCGN